MISKRLRYEVLRRDNHTCRYCGATPADGAKMTVDHVQPTALGGTDAAENLVAACRDCNAGKSSSSPDAPLVAEVAADALRWGQAMKRAAAIQAKRGDEENALLHEVELTWLVWRTRNGEGDHLPRPSDWENSVRSFLRAGLGVDVICEMVDVAMRANVYPEHTWRYFCGCCWRTIEERQEIARSLLSEEESA